MRAVLTVWFFLLLAGIVCAQTQPDTTVFTTIRPDVSIVVKKHSTGADLVEITMRDANYPVGLLKEQCLELGVLLNSEPRGLFANKYKLTGDNPNLMFVKATFAVDGIANPAGKSLRIEPFLKVFAGNEEPYLIEGVSILFDGVAADTWTVQAVNNASVIAEGRRQPSPTSGSAGIEYRIQLKTQNPDEIVFPDRVEEQKAPVNPSGSEGGSPLVTWIAIGVAGVAAGALVYFALLRGGSSSHKSRR